MASKMKKLKVDLDYLEYIFDDASWMFKYFLDIETGEVIMIPENDVDGEFFEEVQRVEEGLHVRYLPVPRPDSREAYIDMEEFIDDVEDRRIVNILSASIRGRGAFRRFKDALSNYPEIERRWFEFKSNRLRSRIKEWLESENIVPIPA